MQCSWKWSAAQQRGTCNQPACNAGWDVPADIAAKMSLASILTGLSHRWDQPVERLYKMYGLQKELQHVETKQATCVPTG